MSPLPKIAWLLALTACAVNPVPTPEKSSLATDNAAEDAKAGGGGGAGGGVEKDATGGYASDATGIPNADAMDAADVVTPADATATDAQGDALGDAP